jgi:hypothetical protein
MHLPANRSVGLVEEELRGMPPAIAVLGLFRREGQHVVVDAADDRPVDCAVALPTRSSMAAKASLTP